MLKVDEIQNGVVIDHITAGTGLALYHMMELEKLNKLLEVRTPGLTFSPMSTLKSPSPLSGTAG